MQKLKIQFLISSIILLLFISCKTYEIPNVSTIESQQKTCKNTYFSSSETAYVYKTTIDVYSKQLSGIFIAKKINDTMHRVVFTTDFGNTLLDFEISEKSFELKHCIDELNKNIILNTLKNDFRLLFKTNHIIFKIFENETNLIYKSKNEKQFNYLMFNKNELRLVQLIQASKTKEKVVIHFQSKNSTLAENIIIDHQNIKVKIELNRIN